MAMKKHLFIIELARIWNHST